MSRVVHLHVGAPRTGNAHLRSRLAANSASLAEHGVHFPRGPLGRDPGHTHLRAALDLLGENGAGHREHADGSWDALVRKVRRTRGTVVVGHELLSAAPPDKIARAMADLDGSEVHVVFSARDLARQLPAVWQESVKQGGRRTFQRFLADVQRSPEGWFWRSQGLPQVLGRWGAGLEPRHVHLVTLPQDPASPDVLWRRFCTAFGIDPAWAPREADRTDPSMGVAETALIRRLNRRLARDGLTEHHHTALVREILVHQNLAHREGRRVRLPPHLHPWVDEVAESWVEWAEGSGIHVVGDLADLRPAPPREDVAWVDPDDPPHARVVAAALDALVAMTAEAAHRPDPNDQLSARLSRAARRLRGT